MHMREWLMADVFLIFVFVALMVSVYFWYVKEKKIAIRFCIAAAIVITFVLGNILYFYIFKEL